MASAPKNIWIASGDGNLAHVQHLVETEGMSPNAPDSYTYTPMHAAASYGHLNVLEYLVSKGGDVNVTDNDGDTPLYTVENIETASWLVDHGAVVERQNSEGVSPADHLEEDFPDISSYLRSLSSQTTLAEVATSATASAPSPSSRPSQHSQEATSNRLTENLLARASNIIARAEAEGRDPEVELREVVGEAVLAGVQAGYHFAGDTTLTTDGSETKRARHSGE